MPYSVIDKGSKYFNTVTYTGTGSNLAITGVGFKPDWVWCKSRSSGTEDHTGWDAVRGSTKRLSPNTTGAEYVDATQGMQSFNTDGFTCGVSDQYNKSGQTQVSWCWLGANTTVSNTSGTISSTVSANTTSGFSIVTYTGNGTSGATIGHGLGVAPNFIIIKCRNVTEAWPVWSSALAGNTSYVRLNATDAVTTATDLFNSTTPTSSLITLGNGGFSNTNTRTYVAYVFANVKGYSKFGSYVGNGSTDGTFVYTGFKPRWIMVKSTGDTGGWTIMDTSRIGYNASNYTLYAEATTAEQGYLPIDILSNGFKLRIVSTGTSFNSNTINYIYMAFAENPFVSSKGIACTAR